MMNNFLIVFQHQQHLFWFDSMHIWCSRKLATCCKNSLLIQSLKSLSIKDKPLCNLVPLHHDYSTLCSLNCGKLFTVKTPRHSHHGIGWRLFWVLWEFTRTQSELTSEPSARVRHTFSAGLLVINQSFVYHAHLFHFNSAVWRILIKTQTEWSHSVCSGDVAPSVSKKLQWNNRFDQFKTWRCLCGLHKLNCSWWCTFEQWRNVGSLNQRHCSCVLNSWKLHRVWKLCNQNCSSNKGHYMPWLTQKPNK